ncbi:hypothetical protein K2X85_08725 [bacterium]|jgi:lysophospholipase L1-like esterase|nr:hypothetical protein [bacterium]
MADGVKGGEGGSFVLEWLGVPLMLVVMGGDGIPLQDHDRIVLLGDTLIEREARFGWTEKALLLATPAKGLTFRNLGWSGDTPAGLSRAYFDPPEVGFQRLVDQVKACQPTVLIVGYGMASALDAIPVATFMEEYRRLVQAIEPPPRVWVFLSPIQTNVPGRSKPSENMQQRLQAYAQAIRQLAEEKKGAYVDLLPLPSSSEGFVEPNGIHLRDAGYRGFAQRLLDVFYPGSSVLQKTLADPLADRVPADTAPSLVSRLDTLIRRKNELYFERYRPQNITYLLGFRAYEQGQNAKEIEALDPAIAKVELDINAICSEIREHDSQEKTSP